MNSNVKDSYSLYKKYKMKYIKLKDSLIGKHALDKDSSVKEYGIHIKKSTIHDAGYGVFADIPFKAGDLIITCPFIEIANDISADNKLMHYVFQSHLTKEHYLVVFGSGSMFNHSNNNNVQYLSHPKYKDKFFIFTALTDIKSGDELFVNYGPDHPVNKSIKN